MNTRLVEDIANAVLYEGYILYPYRPSALKNQQRFTFGIVAPQAHDEAGSVDGRSFVQTEVLGRADASANLSVRVRFLQLVARTSERPGSSQTMSSGTWQEAIEQDVPLCVPVHKHRPVVVERSFTCPATVDRTPAGAGDGYVTRTRLGIEARIRLSCTRAPGEIVRIRVRVTNTTRPPLDAGNRDELLMRSLVSTHAILQISGGEFFTLLDPPEEARTLAAACQQDGLWPVLIGDPDQRDAILASPIILPDFPQIAPESVGDFCDGTEIDEMLALRILTMTDEEKREMREGDERGRRMLERTEALSTEQLMKLHGVLRGLRPVGEDTR